MAVSVLVSLFLLRNSKEIDDKKITVAVLRKDLYHEISFRL
jgi:hypothetical protein